MARGAGTRIRRAERAPPLHRSRMQRATEGGEMEARDC
ncbi:Uncharacterized protein OBRU01_20916, partial [Operophtera brumata]